MTDLAIGTSDWWLHRLVERLMSRQPRYDRLYRYAVGDHDLPPGDQRYAKFLRELMKMSQTNYVGLAIRAVTERMRVKDFKFGETDNVDEDARTVWQFNHMDLQSTVSINDAATFGETYGMVLPPDPNDRNPMPIITIEDPRQCIVEPDPIRPMRSLAGLKFYDDYILNRIVAILILPDHVYTYYGPKPAEYPEDLAQISRRLMSGASAAGFELIKVDPNPIGEVFLVRGLWQPDHGLVPMAEVENGAIDVQDRINFVVLSRLVISHNQAYRQRWMTGAKSEKTKKGDFKPPFDPGADRVWGVEAADAKFGDFEQADIKQLLEATRDDVGDFAAITQTPVTYLTNRMVNVSGDALTSAQAALVSKTRLRMKAMGWFFEQIVKLAFRYQENAKADEIYAEALWADPEVRSLAEIADMVSKFASAGVPMQLILERCGFTPAEVDFAVKEIERQKQEQMAQQQAQMQMQADNAVKVAKATGGQPKPGTPGAKPTGSTPSKTPAKPAAKPKTPSSPSGKS